MKFGQLIEYNIRNIFIEKSNAKFLKTKAELFPDPFKKKSKLSISLDLDNSPKFYAVYFYCIPS